MNKRFMLMFAICIFVPWSGNRATEPLGDSKSFQKNVLPILVKNCGECHQTEASEAGLDLSSRESLLGGSESGAVLVPGNASQSLLIQVLAKEADPHMPPEGQLSADEITQLSKWIDSLERTTQVGAIRRVDGKSDHWAFQPLNKSQFPKVKKTPWARTPVDLFVLARLEREGLSPSPSADKATILRRVFFDLIGLPPTPNELAEFLQDESPDAYERAVERLLASPLYGERWGRHWLDLARYADSSGFHNDFDRPYAWRYRDYVIGSLNADKPYADFLTEQLAGDELPNATAETWIATGFGRNGPSNEDNMGMGLAKQKYRLDQLDDVISTTSNVFLGLTIGCARCHDHKYDPLTQRDYYGFLAYFDNTEPQQLLLERFKPESPSLKPFKPKSDPKTHAAMVLTSFGQKPRKTHILWRGDLRNLGPEVKPSVPRVLSDSPQSVTQGSNSPSSRLSLAKWMIDSQNPLTWRVMANRLWHYHFGRGLVATPSNVGKLGEKPTHPRLLDWLAMELIRSGGSLKSLHRVIVTSAVYRQTSSASGSGLEYDPENRLLWRMNKRRLEAEPLRDAMLHLAGNLNLQMGGPGVKPRIRPDLLVASQRNKWPVVKKEGPEHWRRSVYVYIKRQLQLPMLELFDAPITTHSCARRPESLVPTQPLVLLNDEFVREQARHFADRIVREAGPNPEEQVERGLWMALAHRPHPTRVREGVAFLENQSERLRSDGIKDADLKREALTDFCQVLMNLSEFVYVD